MYRGPPNIQPNFLMHSPGGAAGNGGGAGAAKGKKSNQNASRRASGLAKSQSHLSHGGTGSSADSGESIVSVASAIPEWNQHTLRKLVDAVGRKLSNSPPSSAPLLKHTFASYDVPQSGVGPASNSNHSTQFGRKSGPFGNASLAAAPVISPAFRVPSRMLQDTDTGALEGPRKLQFKAQWASAPRGGGGPSPTNGGQSQSQTPFAISSTLTALKPPGGQTFPPTPATVPSTAQTPHSFGHNQSAMPTHGHFVTQKLGNEQSQQQPNIQTNGYAAPPPLIPINLKDPVKLGGLPINRTAPEFIERLNRVRRARVYGDQLRQIMRSSAANSRASSRQGGRPQQPCQSSDSTGESVGQARVLPDVLAVRRQVELDAEDARARRRKMREYAASIPKPKPPLLPPLSASSTGSIHNVTGRHAHAAASNKDRGGGKRATMSSPSAFGRIDCLDAEAALGEQFENDELEALTRQYMRDSAVFEKIKKGVAASGVGQRQSQGQGLG